MNKGLKTFLIICAVVLAIAFIGQALGIRWGVGQ